MAVVSVTGGFMNGRSKKVVLYAYFGELYDKLEPSKCTLCGPAKK